MKRTLPKDFEEKDDSKKARNTPVVPENAAANNLALQLVLIGQQIDEIVKCVKAGDHDNVERFLKNGAEVNIQCYPGESYLHIACSKLDVEMVKILLEYKANPNQNDNRNFTPGARAICRYIGNGEGFIKLKEILILLRNHGADFNVKSSSSDAIPLLCAAKHHDFSLIELLLKLGVDPNIKSLRCSDGTLNPDEIDCNSSDIGALHLLVLHLNALDRSGVYKSMELLLNSGANIDLQGVFGITPLLMVTHLGIDPCADDEIIFEALRFFIDHGANINIPDCYGNTITEYVVENPTNNLENFLNEVLWDKLDNLNILNSKGYTLLHHCCRNSYIEYIPTLLKRGADPLLHNRDNKSSVELFIHNRDPKAELNCRREGATAIVCHLFSRSLCVNKSNNIDSIGVRLFGDYSYHIYFPSRAFPEDPNMLVILRESCRIKAIKEIARFFGTLASTHSSGLYPLSDDIQYIIASYIFKVSTANDTWSAVYSEFRRTDINLLNKAENVYKSFCTRSPVYERFPTELFLGL